MKPILRAVALLATVAAPLSFADAPAKPVVVPAGANEPAQTIGPLPVAPAAPAAAPTAAGNAAAAQPSGAGAKQDDPRDSFASPLSTPPDGAEPESMVGTLWKMFLALGVVIGLVYITLNYGLRRLMGVRGAIGGRSSLVKVVERIPLDPKRTLFVIEAAGEYLLVGGAETNLNLISKLSGDEVQKVLTQRQAAAAKPSPFLQKLLARPTPATAAAAAVSTPAPTDANAPVTGPSGGRTEET